MKKAIVCLWLFAVAPVVFLSGCGNSVRVNVPSMNEVQRVDVAAAIESTPQFAPSKDQQVIVSILDELRTAKVIGKESNPDRSSVVVSIRLKDGTDIRLFPEYQSGKPVANHVVYEPTGKPGGEAIVLKSAPLWNWLMGGWTKQKSSHS